MVQPLGFSMRWMVGKSGCLPQHSTNLSMIHHIAVVNCPPNVIIGGEIQYV